MLTLAPAPIEALIGRALALEAAGRHEDALTCCDQAARATPNSPDVHYARGCILFDLNRHDEAAGAFDRAVAFKPDFVQAWLRCATRSTRSGDTTKRSPPTTRRSTCNEIAEALVGRGNA